MKIRRLKRNLMAMAYSAGRLCIRWHVCERVARLETLVAMVLDWVHLKAAAYSPWELGEIGSRRRYRWDHESMSHRHRQSRHFFQQQQQRHAQPQA
jgi:hypothetical protein